MSVGTNENVKNVNEIDNVELNKSAENTGGQVTQDTIDMQATQRLDFLGELIKESDNSAEKIEETEQGSTAPENAEEKEEKEDTNTQEPINREEKQEKIQEVNPEEIQKEKEKQHAQDKKDFRLERMLFARINVMQGKIKESLELIQKFERINAKEENLPNIVTTLHDKLTQEVIKQFRTVGIEFNMKSYLVQAIVSDLLCKFEEGVTEFKDCSENLNFVREVQEDFESRVELVPTSKVKNIFARIRGIFKPERKQEKLEDLERERQEKKLQEANIHLLKYKYINSELEKYTIKDNIIHSLTKEILYGQGSGGTLSNQDFIAEKITPEMKKLGLAGLLPELQNKMFTEYNRKNEEITKEQFDNMLIGDIRRNMKGVTVQSKISQTVNMENNQIDDESLAI